MHKKGEETVIIRAWRTRGLQSVARAEEWAIVGALRWASEVAKGGNKVAVLCDRMSLVQVYTHIETLHVLPRSFREIILLKHSLRERHIDDRVNWVKAHVNILGNERVDEGANAGRKKAKQADFISLEYGEFTKDGQLIEDYRKPLFLHGRWGADLAIGIMKVTASQHARRVQAGIETWPEMAWPEQTSHEKCRFCHRTHAQNWRGFAKRCQSQEWTDYRREITDIWKGSPYVSSEATKAKLWGWVTQQEVERMVKEQPGEGEEKQERVNKRMRGLKTQQRRWQKTLTRVKKRWEDKVKELVEETDEYESAKKDGALHPLRPQECSQAQMRSYLRAARKTRCD